MGVAASLILPDLIAGRENPWADVYSPSRKPKTISTLASFVEENISAAGHVAKHALPLSASEPRRPGTGKVVSHRGKKIAVYRDETGAMHRMSASCTHMGCIVQWNSFETCWDCPCHGSQFAATGEVLQGPAVTPLAAMEETPPQKRARKTEKKPSSQATHA
jgi:Rieske Fe-S protein